MRLLFILLLALAPAAGQETAVFRSSVNYVRLDVQVLEGKGNRVLTGLTQQDFLVLDEGVPRTVEYFGRESEPLWLLLLLDVSGSMRRNLKEMAAASRQVLQQLRPEDRVAVMLFARHARLSQDFAAGPSPASEALWAALGETSLGSGTAINEALLAAAAHMRTVAFSQPGRRAILILTDNKGLNYRAPDEAVMEALSQADCVLNAIVPSEARRPREAENKEGLNPDFTPPNVFQLAEQSGGETLQSSKTGEAFQFLLERIRTRYSLHYRAPEAAPGSWRRVQVQLSESARKQHSKAIVRCRRAYRLPEL